MFVWPSLYLFINTALPEGLKLRKKGLSREIYIWTKKEKNSFKKILISHIKEKEWKIGKVILNGSGNDRVKQGWRKVPKARGAQYNSIKGNFWEIIDYFFQETPKKLEVHLFTAVHHLAQCKNLMYQAITAWMKEKKIML